MCRFKPYGVIAYVKWDFENKEPRIKKWHLIHRFTLDSSICYYIALGGVHYVTEVPSK
jgi:hypothetical protein